jgi:NAD-dependent SIR2 family protein deacetylase
VQEKFFCFFVEEERMNEGILQIAQRIAAGGKNIIFTGAGISTESGIPDYRSDGGIWEKTPANLLRGISVFKRGTDRILAAESEFIS